MNKDLKAKGRFLTFVLRHKPEDIGLTIEKNGGWGNVDYICNKIHFSFEELKLIVENDNKNRFSFNETKTKIRANQGHSFDVDLGLKIVIPSYDLFHGTSSKNIDIILSEGLKPMNRLHVHLSNNIDTASQVGKRHQGELVLLKLNTKKMVKDKVTFFISENNVHLVDFVHPKYIHILAN